MCNWVCEERQQLPAISIPRTIILPSSEIIEVTLGIRCTCFSTRTANTFDPLISKPVYDGDVCMKRHARASRAQQRRQLYQKREKTSLWKTHWSVFLTSHSALAPTSRPLARTHCLDAVLPVRVRTRNTEWMTSSRPSPNKWGSRSIWVHLVVVPVVREKKTASVDGHPCWYK